MYISPLVAVEDISRGIIRLLALIIAMGGRIGAVLHLCIGKEEHRNRSCSSTQPPLITGQTSHIIIESHVPLLPGRSAINAMRSVG